MWKFRHIWKIDFLCQYKNIARVFRETTYFHAIKNTRSCRGKVKRRHARKYFPWGAKTWLYDALLCRTFFTTHEKFNKYQKVKISVRRENPNAFLHTKTRILHKKNECVSSFNTLALPLQNPLSEIFSRFCKHPGNIFEVYISS